MPGHGGGDTSRTNCRRCFCFFQSCAPAAGTSLGNHVPGQGEHADPRRGPTLNRGRPVRRLLFGLLRVASCLCVWRNSQPTRSLGRCLHVTRGEIVNSLGSESLSTGLDMSLDAPPFGLRWCHEFANNGGHRWTSLDIRHPGRCSTSSRDHQL